LFPDKVFLKARRTLYQRHVQFILFKTCATLFLLSEESEENALLARAG